MNKETNIGYHSKLPQNLEARLEALENSSGGGGDTESGKCIFLTEDDDGNLVTRETSLAVTPNDIANYVNNFCICVLTYGTSSAYDGANMYYLNKMFDNPDRGVIGLNFLSLTSTTYQINFSAQDATSQFTRG